MNRDLDYAMGRMDGMLTELRDPGFRVFRSMEEPSRRLIPGSPGSLPIIHQRRATASR